MDITDIRVITDIMDITDIRVIMVITFYTHPNNARAAMIGHQC